MNCSGVQGRDGGRLPRSRGRHVHALPRRRRSLFGALLQPVLESGEPAQTRPPDSPTANRRRCPLRACLAARQRLEGLSLPFESIWARSRAARGTRAGRRRRLSGHGRCSCGSAEARVSSGSPRTTCPGNHGLSGPLLAERSNGLECRKWATHAFCWPCCPDRSRCAACTTASKLDHVDATRPPRVRRLSHAARPLLDALHRRCRLTVTCLALREIGQRSPGCGERTRPRFRDSTRIDDRDRRAAWCAIMGRPRDAPLNVNGALVVAAPARLCATRAALACGSVIA